MPRRWPRRADGEPGTFASLRLPNFRLLLAGTTLSNAAQWIQQVTLGWLVYDLTASGTMLGTINLVRAAATLGLAPAAGVAIDRVPRRRLMLLVNSWLLAISLALGVALLAGHAAIGYLFAFTFLGGAAQAIDLPLRQTVVFVLVPRALAPNAVALIQTGWALMRSLGPALGGFLILWFGPAGNFLVRHNLPATGGASGSPIFLADGSVAAVLNAGNIILAFNPQGDSVTMSRAPSAAGVNYAQRIDILRDLVGP